MSGEQWGEAVDAGTPAVLAEMDWPDDREASAHVEPDGYCVTPPGAYWEIAQGIAAAVLAKAAPLIVADTRRKVAEETAATLADTRRAIREDHIPPYLAYQIAIEQIVWRNQRLARGSGNGDSGQEGT